MDSCVRGSRGEKLEELSALLLHRNYIPPAYHQTNAGLVWVSF